MKLTVKAADLASFDEAASAWVVAEGEYQFLIGASSQDIKATLKANAKAPADQGKRRDEAREAHHPPEAITLNNHIIQFS